MSTLEEDKLARALSEESEWPGPDHAVWRRALDQVTNARGVARSWLFRRIPAPALLAACVALAVVLGVVIAPAFTTARSNAPSALSMASAPEREVSYAENAARALRRNAQADTFANQLVQEERGALVEVQGPSSEAPGAARAVHRKATLELRAPDVRAAFLKAQQVVSEARGEYIQDSSLTGDGALASANLTLRIAADRLGDVLNTLRGLGVVASESISGEDVTGQAVDLEARLRNEQRFEAELLRLLDARQDAPLKEVLELRDRISDVRRTVEQLTAQRDRLSRLVSLATVLVLIRADGAPKAEGTSILDYFGAAIAGAWRSSLRFLADSAAFVVRTLVGGLLVWIVIVGSAIVIRRRLIRPEPRRPVAPPA